MTGKGKRHSADFRAKLAGVRISMDGRGRWVDQVFIERLRRPLKYDGISLNACKTGSEVRAGFGSWVTSHNRARRHAASLSAEGEPPQVLKELSRDVEPPREG
jgi:putative transposase